MSCTDGHDYENGRCVDCGLGERSGDYQLSPLYERSLSEVGEALGMSPQMVHFVEQRALRKLRRVLRTKHWGREEAEDRCA